MIKLVDYTSETKEVTFGTCEVCMRTGTLTEEAYIFRNDNGEKLAIPVGHWSWGDYDIYYDVKNVIKFGDFIEKLELKTLKELQDNFPTIHQLYVDLYEARL